MTPPKLSNPPSRPKAPAVTLDGLSPEQAQSVGSEVGKMLADGMPGAQAIALTGAIADFVRRGISAQRAVDEILDEHRRSARQGRRQRP